MIFAVVHSVRWYENLSFNWFDVALLAMLVVGYLRGRKNGMSREIVPTCMWLTVVLGAGFGHQILGQWLIESGLAGKMLGGLAKYVNITCYLLMTIVIVMIYSLVAKRFREKVTGSNTFGSNEYYLGMGAGIIRYACILMFVLALLNAPFYSAAEIAVDQAYKARWYGGGEKGFSGDFIPSMADVQSAVFKKSFTGPFIENDMSFLLVHNGAIQPGKRASAGH